MKLGMKVMSRSNCCSKSWKTIYGTTTNLELFVSHLKSIFIWDIKTCIFISQPMFRENISPPSSRLKNKSSKEAARSSSQFTMVSCLAYSSASKHGADMFLRNTYVSVDYQWTTDYWLFIIASNRIHIHLLHRVLPLCYNKYSGDRA
jgi:hypothetical protein